MNVRSLEGLHVYPCPHCGKRLVGDPKAATFAHEEPTCAGFAAWLAKWPSFRPVPTERTVYLADPAQGKKPLS